MKKILSFILITALLIGALTVIPFYSFAKEKDMSPVSVIGMTGDCSWELDYQGKLTITGPGRMGDYETYYDAPWEKYSPMTTSIEVGHGVTYIGKYAFSSLYNVTNVQLSKSITEIGPYAFRGCTALTGINIYDNITKVGDYAFQYCYALKNVKLSKYLTEIGEGMFDSAGLESINIPESVTAIGNKAFYSCRSLQSVSVPGSVTKIGERAFCNCVRLSSVSIPSSVTNIGERVFEGCKGSVGICLSDAFESEFCPVFYGFDGRVSVRFDDSVTKIKDRFFSGCYTLTYVDISDNITSIGDYAFECCTELSDIYLPDSISYIGEAAFWGTGIREVRVPDGLTELRDSTFADCTALKRVLIPASVERIGYAVFSSGIGGEGEHAIETRTDFIMYGMEGSFADQFAHMYGIPFFPLDKYPPSLYPTESTDWTEESTYLDITLDSSCYIVGDTVTCKAFLHPGLPDKQIDFYYNSYDSDESFYLGSRTTGTDGTCAMYFKADSRVKDVYAVYAEDPWVKSNTVRPVVTDPTSQTESSWYTEESSGTEPPEIIKIGDADGDGTVTVADATRIQQWLVNLIDESMIDLEAAKTTNQPVTIADATRIQLHLAHIIDLEA